MAFEPLYDVIRADFKSKLGSSQFVAECRLVPESGVQIKKVLSIDCGADILSCEPVQGEARVSGRVNFHVLFTDTAEEAHAMDYSVEFNEKITGAGITPGLKTEPVCGIMDTDTVSATAGEIKLACVTEIALYAVAAETVNSFKSAGDEVFVNREKLAYCALSGSADETFTVTEDKALKEDIARILLCDGAALLKEAVCGEDSVRVTGTVYADALCETEDKKLISVPIEADFDQEIAARGAKAGHDVHAEVYLKNIDVHLEKDTERNSTVLKSEIRLNARADVYSREEGEITTDAFSVTHELNITGGEFNIGRYLFTKNFNEKIDGSAALGTDMPYMDGIMAVCAARINIANALAETDRVRLEGLVNACVVYWNSETESKNSVQIELPFTVGLPCEGITEGAEVSAHGVITDIDARPKKGAEVDISARVCFTVYAYGRGTGYCVKEIEQGAPRTAPVSALAVYITREGESLWDVAKALCATPELITTFNPALKLPLSGNERVLVYRQM
jgi:hypothetical protein